MFEPFEDPVPTDHDQAFADAVTIGPGQSAATRGDDQALRTGAYFGPFELIRTLGEGGMGVVYLARQKRPRRQIAVKVLRAGLATSAARSRFDREAELFARLRHPCIAQVYDAGTIDAGDERRPYLAMEYVDGTAIDDHVRDQMLSPRDILGLYVKVCDAVHHAHTRGVIHRDLKPANIMIEQTGRPKVLDFGVARAFDQADDAAPDTLAGALVGTVPYMSPEQVSGDPLAIDTRSDVYALGVVLYELIAGCLPYDLTRKSVAESVTIIAEQDPAPLANSTGALHRDLSTILNKALEKDPERRYQSAADFGQDLEHVLRDEPIHARPPSAVYLMTKFARRNRALFGGLVVAAAAIALGVVATTWQAYAATRARNIAEIKRQEAETDAAIARETNTFLTRMLRAADPEVTEFGDDLDVTVRDVVHTAAAELEHSFADQPLVKASLHRTIGATLHAVGDYPPAEQHLTTAVDLYRDHGWRDRRETFSARRDLALTLTDMGRLDDAEAMNTALIAELRKQFGDSDPDTIMVQGELARVYTEQGRLDEAADVYAGIIAAAHESIGPDDPTFITLLHNLAGVRRQQGRFDEAEKLLRQALDARREHFGETHPQTLYAANALATVLERTGDFDEAASMLEQTLEHRRTVLGEDHPVTITTALNLGNVLIRRQRFEEAEPLVRFALTAYRDRLGESHAKTLIAMNALAYLLEDTGQYEEAEQLYRETIRIKEASGVTNVETFGVRNNLAMLLHRMERLDEADAAFRETLGHARAALPEDHFMTAIVENNYGDLLVDLGRHDDARRYLDRSMARLIAIFGEDHPRVAKAHARLSRLDGPVPHDR